MALLAQSTYTVRRAAKDGIDAYTVLLSPESVAIPANAAGVVLDYSTAKTTIIVKRGGETVTPTYGGLVTSNCVATREGDVVSITSIPSNKDIGYVDIPISHDTVSIVKRFVFAKVKEGQDGEADYDQFRTEYDAELTQLSDEISSRVKQDTYAEDMNGLSTRVSTVESTITQQADKFDVTIKALSKETNLLTKPSYDVWSIYGGWTIIDDYAIRGTNLGQWVSLRSNFIPAVAGDTFSITANINNQSNKNVAFQVAEHDGMVEQNNGTTAYWNDNARGDIEATFTTSNPNTQYIRVGVFVQENSTGTITVRDMMLVKGSVPLPFNQLATEASVRSSLMLKDNKITLFGKTIELLGTTIAEAIKAGNLDVGDGNFTVGQDGKITAKGATVGGTLKTAEDGARVEINNLDNTLSVIDENEETRVLIKPTAITSIANLSGTTKYAAFNSSAVSETLSKNGYDPGYFTQTWESNQITLSAGRNYKLSIPEISFQLSANKGNYLPATNIAEAYITVALLKVVDFIPLDGSPSTTIVRGSKTLLNEQLLVTGSRSFTHGFEVNSVAAGKYKVVVSLAVRTEHTSSHPIAQDNPSATAAISIASGKQFFAQSIERFTEIGIDGIVSVHSPTSYFHVAENAVNIRYGDYFLQVSSAGLQKSTDGTNWTTL